VLAAVVLSSVSPARAEILEIPGLSAPAKVSTDALGVPHIEGQTFEDAVRVQGWVHARDRFFQMDVSRRRALGTLAELTGLLLDLQADATVRTLGLEAAVLREGELLSERMRGLLQAYADGVNGWLATHPLPPEYAELELSRAAPWRVLDTLALVKGGRLEADNRSFELIDTDQLASYEAAGDAQGFDGTALLVEDVARFAPMLQVATVPSALASQAEELRPRSRGRPHVRPGLALARRHAQRLPADLDASARDRNDGGYGSNVWAVSADRAAGGALLANDNHSALGMPSAHYELHLRVANDPELGSANLSGISTPGLPAITAGQSAHLAFGGTAFFLDRWDYFEDRLVRGDPACPSRLCIDSAGALHPVEERRERYFQNQRDDSVQGNAVEQTDGIAGLAPQAVRVLSVPFRSFGPIVEVEDRDVVDDPVSTPAETEVLTLQYAALHGTRAADGLLSLLTATSVAESEAALRELSFGGNLAVADRAGRVAYYGTGEVPLRADLEAGTVLDGGPWLVRDGSGPSNWVPDPARSQGQAIPFAVVPFEEMPRIVDPPAGFLVNANADPLGTFFDNDPFDQFRPGSPGAIYFLGANWQPALREARIEELLQEQIDAAVPLALEDMRRVQTDTVMMDARLLVPYLLDAFAIGQAPGAPPELAALATDPALVEAVARLGAWDFSSPTGTAEGYDASDADGVRDQIVAADEAAASVAATLYQVWRGELIEDVITAPLAGLGLEPNFPLGSLNGVHHLLSQVPFTGVGASGIDFFPEPMGLVPDTRRDVTLLQALRDALDRLASDTFAPAFANSTDPDDYRWGRLHRHTFAHPLGEDRNVPPAAGFEHSAPDLPGLSRDGAFQTVNNSSPPQPDARTPEAFLSRQGASSRWVTELSPVAPGADGLIGSASLPGGASGDAASPLYASQLGAWLTGDHHALLVTADEIAGLPSEDAIPVPVSKAQQRCVRAVSQGGAAVGKAQGKQDVACLAAAAKGEPTDPQACLTGDARGKITKARDRALAGEARKCAADALPVFGSAGQAAASDAGAAASLALVEDLFGLTLNGVAIAKAANAAGAACQGELLKRAQAALEAVWKEAGKAQKNALAGKKGAAPASSGIDLQAALLSVFAPSDKVEKALAKVEKAAAARCDGAANLAAAFPGRCKAAGAATDATALGGCVRERVLCQGCRAIGAMEALALPCDALDDGAVDDSCG
jgi:penicillin amidase